MLPPRPRARPLCAILGVAAAASGLLGAAAGARPPQFLSEEPRLEYRTDFLNASVAAALRACALELGLQAAGDDGAAGGGPNGGEEFSVLKRPGADGPPASRDCAAARHFEAKAATWARLPLGAAAPVVARWETWAPGSHLNRSGPLHLDPRLRAWNRKTVLAYLGSNAGAGATGAASEAGAADRDDGATVFPCVETDDMEPAEAGRRRRLCSQAHNHLKLAFEKLLTVHAQGLDLPPSQQFAFLEAHPELTVLPKVDDRGARPTNWLWTPAHDQVWSEAQAAVRSDPLNALAEAMCRGRALGLRVPSRAGAAVLLETASPRGGRRGKAPGQLVPDWRLWHAGCSPLRGWGRRWTAQLFLQEPPAVASPPLAPPARCAEGAQTCGAEEELA